MGTQPKPWVLRRTAVSTDETGIDGRPLPPVKWELMSQRNALWAANENNRIAIARGHEARYWAEQAPDKPEDPEPVDLGRVAMEAFEFIGGGWNEQSPRLQSAWRAAAWRAAASAVLAAMPPRELTKEDLTDEEIGAGLDAVMRRSIEPGDRASRYDIQQFRIAIKKAGDFKIHEPADGDRLSDRAVRILEDYE